MPLTLSQAIDLSKQKSYIGKYSPWGFIDNETCVAEGIFFVSTPGHGGYKLDRKKNALIPSIFRRKAGWYEEDSGYAIVHVFLKQFFTQEDYDKAIKILKDWYWKEYEEYFRETLQEGESFLKDKHNFYIKHAKDWVVIAAQGSYQGNLEKFPENFVGVCAKLGEIVPLNGTFRVREYSESVTKYFLVPEGEYRNRNQMGFVIDLAKHQEVGAF